MRGSRPRIGGATVAVALSVLAALGVALATRSAPTAGNSVSAADVRAETATPQALSMGGAVPSVRPAAKPTWAIRSRQLRVSRLSSVYFVDDQEGFAGGDGVLFATHDGGATWTAASIPAVGGSLAAIACTSPAECLAGGWTATDAVQLLYTRDAGATWRPASLPSGLRDLTHLACWNSVRCLAVGQGAGQDPWELQSADAGQTWTTAAPPPGVKSMAILECSAVGTCLAGGGSGSFANFFPQGTAVMDRSTDGGRSWHSVSLPSAPGTSPASPPTAVSCPTASVCYEASQARVELKSTDGGASWQVASSTPVSCPPGQPFCPAVYQVVAMTFVTADIGWRTTFDLCGGFNFAVESYQSCASKVEKTTDGGRNWVASASTDFLPAISCPDANHCWAAETTNTSGSLIATVDGGARWSVNRLPATGLLYNFTCASASLCFASGSDQMGDPAVLRSRDAGRSWTSSTLPVPAPAPSSTAVVGPHGAYVGGFACLSATTCLAATTTQLVETRDAGSSWSLSWRPPPNSSGSSPTLFGVSCFSRSSCVVPTSSGLFHTVDAGRTWVKAGAKESGSLSVICSPVGLCLADDLAGSGPHSTGILVSTDGGVGWRTESISMPAGLKRADASTSLTPAEVYYLSCWTRARCAALGLGYTERGAKRWYALSTKDAGATWSTKTLPDEISGVGSLACAAGGQCLIAGSRADRAALWSLHGFDVRSLTGPAWAQFAQLTALTCPASGRCVGTAMANNASVIFDLLVPVGSSGWTDSLPTPRAAFSNVDVDIKSAAVAAGAALFITFPSQLFNLTFQENYAEILAWGRRVRRRMRRLVAPFGSRSVDHAARTVAVTSGGTVEQRDRSRPMEMLTVGLTGALLGTLLNPALAIDTATLAGYLGVTLALVVSLACIAGSLALYRVRRRLHDPLLVHALPLGLVVAAGCVIVSRLANFEPGYLYGVVCGVALGRRLREHEEAHIAALSTAATLTVAVVSWLVWVPVHAAAQHGGFFADILDSALVALVVGGLVNTVIILLPLRFLAGWTLIRWRKAVWAAAFVLALFGVIALLARSPVSPAAHTSPLTATIGFFAAFGGGSVVFRSYFDRKWRQAHGVEIHGLRAHVRELLSVRPTEDVAVVSATGSAQVVMEDEKDDARDSSP